MTVWAHVLGKSIVSMAIYVRVSSLHDEHQVKKVGEKQEMAIIQDVHFCQLDPTSQRFHLGTKPAHGPWGKRNVQTLEHELDMEGDHLFQNWRESTKGRKEGC